MIEASEFSELAQEFFAALAPCEEYKDRTYNRDAVREMITTSYDVFESYKKIADQLTKTFMLGLREDIHRVLSHLPETQGEFNESPDEALAQKIGKHALDVSKIAVGVAGGIILATRYLSKRTK
ncbi:hypothetical protein H7X69_01210 [Candidatus Saccharibacteria bacterium]|nr:hypothetical protein [Candidatus Saccharibacteria bacterium]